MKTRSLFLEYGKIICMSCIVLLQSDSATHNYINRDQAQDLAQSYQNPTLEFLPLNKQNSDTNNTTWSLYNLKNIGLVNWCQPVGFILSDKTSCRCGWLTWTPVLSTGALDSTPTPSAASPGSDRCQQWVVHHRPPALEIWIQSANSKTGIRDQTLWRIFFFSF